jgi:gliding motility-associated-like protein
MNSKAGFSLSIGLLLTFFGGTTYAQTAPTFTSSPPLGGVYNQSYAYNITTSDVEADSREIILESGSLPAGLALVDHGDGTATISGTVTETGPFPLVLTVRQLVDGSQFSSQPFTLTIDKATPNITWTNPANIVFGTSLNAVQLNASANIAGTFSYTPGFGAVLNAGVGQTLSTNFTPGDLTNYHVVTGFEVLITVEKATPFVSWVTPGDILYGTPLGGDQLNASSNVAGSFVYTPPAGTLLAVGFNQTLSVSFYPTNSTDYNSVEDIERSINVFQGLPVISWANPSPIVYGTLLSAVQLNASTPVPGSFIYDPPVGTQLDAGADQILSVDFIPTDMVNYGQVNGTTVLITVEKALPAIIWPTPSPIRINEPLTATQLNASTTVAGTFTYSPPLGTSFSANGMQTLTVDFVPTDALNYESVIGTTVQISIDNREDPVISWPAPSAITYGTALSVTQLNAGANVAGSFSYNPPLGQLLDAGLGQTLSVTFTPTDGTNYNTVSKQVAIDVAKAQLNVTADNATRAFGSTNPILPFSYSGFVNGENASVLDTQPVIGTTAIPSTDTGDYPITVSGGVDTNYSFNYIPGTLTITKVMLTVTANNQVRFFGSPNPTLTIAYSGFVNGDNAGVLNTAPTPSTGANVASPVGSYSIGVSGGLDNNYNFSYVAGTLTISKAIVTITADNKSRSYGSSNPPLTFSYSGFINGDDASDLSTAPTISTTATLVSAVGTFPITVSGGVDDNYQFNYIAASLSVVKASLTVTAENKVRAYGASNPTFNVNYSGFVNGESSGNLMVQPVASTSATITSNAGTYPITVSGGVDNNYAFNYVPATLTVSKIMLNVTANNQSRAYGVGNPSLTVSYTGFVNGETSAILSTVPSATTTATILSNVGNYPITVAGGVDENYQFTYAAAVLTINKATLTVTANNQNRFYGFANPPLTIVYSGFANGETTSVLNTVPVITTSANISSNVGNYPITISGGVDNNYAFNYVQGTLSINKILLTVKADNKNRPYGAVNPALTFSYSGFVNGEGAAHLNVAPTATTTATVASGAGSYPISVSGGSDNNYDFTYTQGQLTIDKIILTATAQNQTRFYGYANPTLTFTYTGFVNGENATVLDTKPVSSTIAVTSSAPGTYPIIISGGADNNYDFNYLPGVLTINKVTLTVKADDQNRTYGSPNPVLSISYTGFVNEENVSVLNTAPTASASVTQAHGAGTYPISVSGGIDDYYNFSYVPGVFTVTKASLTVKADDQTRLVGEPNPIFTLSYSGFVNQENPAVLDSPPIATTAANELSLAGSYVISLSGGTDNNYDLILQNGLLVVNNIPSVENAEVSMFEDVVYKFNYADFGQHFLDDSWDRIRVLKVVSTPVNGVLLWKGSGVSAGDLLPVEGALLNDLTYQPALNYNGDDSFRWNASDGVSFALADASLLLKVSPVNDPPTLTNIEPLALEYSPGDKPIRLTEQLVINDVDGGSIFSALVSVSESFSKGDQLLLTEPLGLEMEKSFNETTGELTLTGKNSKSNYEKLLTSVLFSSPVGNASKLLEKKITFTVTDSLAMSNPVSRAIKITEVFPDIEIVNSFTPNQDGVNDVWDFKNLAFYESIKISIFNQGGIQVFDCGQEDCAWDGRLNGRELPAGPYFYIIDLNEGKRKYQGMVTILR